MMIERPAKWCPGCEQSLEVALFSPNPARSDGLASHCRPCANAYAKQLRARRRTESFEYHRNYMREYRASHPETVLRDRANARQWRRDNPERGREALHRMRVLRPDYFREHDARRRISRLGTSAEVSLSDVAWAEIKREFGGACGYCLRRDQPLTQDHMIPLSRGGDHTLSNVIPACKSCNSSKNSKTPIEYLRYSLSA